MNNNFQNEHLIKCSLSQIGDKMIETCEDEQICQIKDGFLECNGYNNDYYATIGSDDVAFNYSPYYNNNEDNSNLIYNTNDVPNNVTNSNTINSRNNNGIWSIIIGVLGLLLILGLIVYLIKGCSNTNGLLTGGCGCGSDLLSTVSSYNFYK